MRSENYDSKDQVDSLESEDHDENEASTWEDEASPLRGTLIKPNVEGKNGAEEPIPPPGPQNEQIQRHRRKPWKYQILIL